MPTTYRIDVVNRSGMYCNYFLFVEAPYVDGGARVYQVVYLCPDKNGSDRATFTCYADYHGVCGISPNKRLTARVSVNVTDSRPVKLGEEDKDHGTRLLMSGGLKPDGGGGRSAKFIESNDSESRGRFQIDCCDFVYNNGANQFVGLGAQDPNDPSHIVPIAVVEATPSAKYFFVPHPTYYISWGNYRPGQIIDSQNLQNPAKIDFTRSGNSKATVVHNSNGTWSVT